MATVGELIYKITGDLGELKKSVSDSEKELAKVKKGFEETDKTIRQTSKTTELLSRAMQGIAAFIGARAIFRFLTETSRAFDEANSIIVTGTGASGDALKELNDIVRTVARDVPQSIQDVASVVAEVNTRLRITDSSLQQVSRQFLDFARVNRIDVTTAVANVTRFMADAGIATERVGEVLDKLTHAAQISGANIVNLTNTAVQYGVQMRAVGLELDETIALLARFEKEGVSTEKIFAGLSIAVGRLAQEGVPDIADAFRLLTGDLEANENQAQAVRDAIEILGVRAGPDFALAVQEGRFAIGDWVDEIRNAEGALSRTASESLTASESIQIMRRQLEVFFEPALNKATNGLTRFVQNITKVRRETQLYIEELDGLGSELNEATDEMRQAAESGDEEMKARARQRVEAGQLRLEYVKLARVVDLLRTVEEGTINQRKQATRALKDEGVVLTDYATTMERIFKPGNVQDQAARALEEYTEKLDDVRKAQQEVIVPTERAAEKTEASTRATKAQEEAAKKAAQELESFRKGMLGIIENAQNVRAALEDTMAKAFERFGDSVSSTLEQTNERLAQIVVSAEEKIKQLRQRLSAEEDDRRRQEIQSEIDAQQQILNASVGFERRRAKQIADIRRQLEEAGIDADRIESLTNIQSLEEQVAEQRRLASLDEFTRFEEQQFAKLLRLADDFVKEVQLAEGKIAKQKELEQDLTNFLMSTTQVRQQTIDEFAQQTIARYGDMARELRRVLSMQAQLGAVTQPQFHSGGFVGPSGGQVHSGEYVVPAHLVSRFGSVVSALEGARTGVVNNRSVNAPVTINASAESELDFRAVAREMGFELQRLI